jgi:murein DD-endopeptidase MepM/ murein hydrolase activator NlpD
VRRALALVALAVLAGCHHTSKPTAAPRPLAHITTSTTSRTSSPTSTSTTTTSTTAPVPKVVHHVFPEVPASVAHYGHYHHDYPATDVLAPCGTTVVAPVDGVIQEVSTVDRWDPKVNDGATRGGLSWSIVGDDGVRYYGSHLSALASTTKPGVRVAAGTVLGKVGNTGDARGLACHLHFGLSPPCGPGDWAVRRGTLYPWPYLDAWRAGINRSPAPQIGTCH